MSRPPITRSLRFRVTMWSVLIAAVVLVVGGVTMAITLRRQMVTNIDRVLMATVSGFEDGARPPRVVRPNGDPGDPWFFVENSEFAVQVLDADGLIVTSSRALSVVEEPLVAKDGLPDSIYRRPFTVETADSGRYRVLVRQIGRGERAHFVVMASTMRDVDRAISAQAGLLALVVPSLVALLGVLIWKVTGSALKPVESIRREVDEISGDQLHRRVRVPEGSYELEGLATTMNQMLDRLDSSAETQRRFVDDASHELRSPLAGIRGLLEVSLAHPGQWDETGPEMLGETLRMQGLVDDLMTLARGDSRGSRVRSQLLDLDDLVLAEGARLVRETSLQVDLAEVSAAQVLGDESALLRVVRNLADNAARHATSRIWFSLSEAVPSDTVELVVTDDGPGVNPREVDRIFERFARLESARDRDSGGSGLGLAITRTIVSQHGGTIELDTSYRDGARFVVRLPAP